MVTISTVTSSSFGSGRLVQRERAKLPNNGRSKRISRLKMRKIRDCIRRVMLKKKYTGKPLRTATASPLPHSSPSPHLNYAKLPVAPKSHYIELSPSPTNSASGNQLWLSESDERGRSVDDSASIYARESSSLGLILSELAFDTPSNWTLFYGPVSQILSPLSIPQDFPESTLHVSSQWSKSESVCTEYFPPHQIPTEVFLLILEYEDRDAFIFKRLLNVRGVCRLWRSTAMNLAKCRSLISPPGFFTLLEDNEQAGEMRQWVNNTIAASYPIFDMLSFSLCSQFLLLETRLDIDLVISFTTVLDRCRRAVMTVDLAHVTADLSDNRWMAVPRPFECLYLHDLSWTSSHIGIDDHLPWYFRLSGSTLATGIPWRQLTNLSLECPLSTHDVFRILYLSRATLRNISLDLKPKNDPTSDSKVLQEPDLSLENLRSLSIRSNINLLTLFLKLDLPTLLRFNLYAYSDFVRMDQVMTVLDRFNIPWASLQDLSLRNDAFIIDSCDLGSILSQCNHLQRLTLTCHNQGRFTATSVPELSQLSDVTLNMDVSCGDLLNALEEQPISKLILSAPLNNSSYLDHFKDTLTHLSVKEDIEPDTLCEILRTHGNLVCAEFHVKNGAWKLQSDKIDCRRLTSLKIHSNIQLAPLWEVLVAIDLVDIQLRFGRLRLVDGFSLSEIRPLLNNSSLDIVPGSLVRDIYSCSMQLCKSFSKFKLCP